MAQNDAVDTKQFRIDAQRLCDAVDVARVQRASIDRLEKQTAALRGVLIDVRVFLRTDPQRRDYMRADSLQSAIGVALSATEEVSSRYVDIESGAGRDLLSGIATRARLSPSMSLDECIADAVAHFKAERARKG